MSVFDSLRPVLDDLRSAGVSVSGDRSDYELGISAVDDRVPADFLDHVPAFVCLVTLSSSSSPECGFLPLFAYPSLETFRSSLRRLWLSCPPGWISRLSFDGILCTSSIFGLVLSLDDFAFIRDQLGVSSEVLDGWQD